MLALSAPLVRVSAQTQIVTATPGYINLGMTTSIAVTAPAAGTYTVVVEKPNGTTSSLSYTFTAAGQTQTNIFGNATSGFGAIVNSVGTYNVFVEQGSTVVGTSSFYATNKLIVTMDMVTGGTCTFIQDITRGMKFIPRFYLHYASNDASLTNESKVVYITFTTPTGEKANASWDSFSGLFDDAVLPNWNYTAVGSWNPTVTAADAYGNTGTFKYTGIPFMIAPTDLSTNIAILNAATGQTAAGLYNGEGIVIQATITYPTNAEPVKGFVGPLNSTRGGSVTAQVGWGFYNSTSNTFGSSKQPGGLLGTVLMTYTGSNGTWTGQFKSSSLPTLPSGANYEAIVSSKDAASPANTGFATYILPAATAPAAQTSTVSTISTTTSLSVQTVTQTVQTIPTVVYAALAILLIVGVLIGYIVRIPRSADK